MDRIKGEDSMPQPPLRHRGYLQDRIPGQEDSHHAKRRLALAQEWRTVADVVPSIAQAYPQDPLCWHRVERSWTAIDAAALAERTGRLAVGLLERDVSPGDHVAVVSQNSFDRLVVDTALAQAGAVVVPINEYATEDDLRWVLRDCGAVCVLVDNDKTAEVIKQISTDNAHIEAVLPIQPSAKHRDVNDLLAASSSDYEAEIAGVRPDIDPYGKALCLYEFGTAQRPTAVNLSHREVLGAARAWSAHFPTPLSAGEAMLSFQSPSSVLAGAIRMVCWATGFAVAHSDPARVSRDIEELGPGLLLSDHRFLDRLFDAALRKARRAGRTHAFWSALGRDVDTASRSFWRPASAQRVMVDRLRRALGGNLRFAFLNDTNLREDIQALLAAVDATSVHCFSLAEAGGPIATSRTDFSGLPCTDADRDLSVLPGVAIATDDEGQLTARAEWTSSAGVGLDTPGRRLDAAGWLKTGRLGSATADALRLAGHVSPRVTTTAGTVVNPEILEEKLRDHSLINHAVVVGDGQACLGALVTLNLDAAVSWLNGHVRKVLPYSSIVTDPDVLNAVRLAVDMTNETLRITERIGPVKVLPQQFSRERGHLTPALKIRREEVVKAFAADIDAMFGHSKRG